MIQLVQMQKMKVNKIIIIKLMTAKNLMLMIADLYMELSGLMKTMMV